jgi:hypothetical protein
MSTNNEIETEKLSPDIINLVVARLKTIPSNARLSIGGEREALSADDLIEEVKKKSEIGKKVIEAQLFFLRSLQDLPLAGVN